MVRIPLVTDAPKGLRQGCRQIWKWQQKRIPKFRNKKKTQIPNTNKWSRRKSRIVCTHVCHTWTCYWNCIIFQKLIHEKLLLGCMCTSTFYQTSVFGTLHETCVVRVCSMPKQQHFFRVYTFCHMVTLFSLVTSGSNFKFAGILLVTLIVQI